MFDIQNRVGRFVEVRAGGELDFEELKRFRSEFTALLVKTTGPLVICVDWRQVTRIDEEVLPLLVGIMRSDNPRLLRAAHLTSEPNAAQVAQVTDASKNLEHRRCFDAPVPLVKWVEEVLEPEESAAARRFFGLPA